MAFNIYSKLRTNELEYTEKKKKPVIWKQSTYESG